MFNRIFRTTVLAALGVLLAVLVLGSLVMVHFLGWDQLGKVGLYFILPGLGIGAIAFFLCGVAAHLTAQKIAAPLNAIAPGNLPDKKESLPTFVLLIPSGVLLFCAISIPLVHTPLPSSVKCLTVCPKI